MKTIFKKGDRVFDYLFGWGTVISYYKSFTYGVEVKFDNYGRKESFTHDGRYDLKGNRTLSHTEYTLEGFTQREAIEESTPIYVKDRDHSSWVIRIFSHFNEKGLPVCYADGNLSGCTIVWEEYSIEKPKC